MTANRARQQTEVPLLEEELAPIARVMAMTGCSRTRLYSEIKVGKFPAPLKKWGRSLWVVSEVRAWIRLQIEQCPRMGTDVGRKSIGQ